MKNSKHIIVLPVLYSLMYLLSLIFPSEYSLLMNTLLSLFGSTCAMIFCIKIYQKLNIYKKYWLYMTFSCICYLLGHIILSIQSTFVASHAIMFMIGYIFYFLASLFMFLSIHSICFHYRNKWSNFLFSIDTIIMSTFFGLIVYKLFISYLSSIITWTPIDYCSACIFIILDALILIELLAFTLPNRRILNLSKSSIIYGIGYILFIISHMNFYYEDINNVYSSIQFINVFVPLSFLWITSAGIYMLLSKEQICEDSAPSKLVHQSPYAIDGTHPMLIATSYLGASLLFYDKLVVQLILLIILSARYLCYKYLKMHVKNNYLLQQYKDVNKLLKVKIEEINKLNLSLESKVIDRTKELQTKNKKLYDMANTDALTGLPNRRNFIKKLNQLIHGEDQQDKFALLFIDLDRFKSINDLYGHKVGDRLLIEVANRLKQILSPTNFIARQSGDEFIVILSPIQSKEHVQGICHRLNKEFEQPFLIDDYIIISTVSIGCAIYPSVYLSYSELMRYADIALYRSKSDGRNTYTIFNSDLQKEVNRKMLIESQLFNALKQNEFELYYQPQLDLATNKIVGLEALIRWHNKELGFVSPSEFIHIAEENGTITSLGYFVLREACIQAKKINQKVNQDIKIGINISPKQFLTTNLVDNIIDIISTNNIDPKYIDLEITEECGIKNEEKTISKLKSLKELGITISIDDFGTGYSSLSYLKSYPIDTLKIAMELTKGIQHQIEDLKIVQAIIAMSNSLNVSVIAEGVETIEQLNILQSLGCHKIQGYYIGKPMPINEIMPMLLH